MIISLAGYMGSGKSRIATALSAETGLRYIDLDKEIAKQSGTAVTDIFMKKGELFFRRREREVLEELLAAENNFILSLGGGTPCYYNNMDVINENSVSIYLRAKVPTLVERLKTQKSRRPLIANIADDDLPEFIAKHLFERNAFYSRASYTVDTDGKSPEEIAAEITLLPELLR